MSWERMRELAEEAARAGGRVLEEWSTRFTVTEKSPANLVTEADFASQQAIHTLLRRACPDHGFLGEEGLDEPSGSSPFRWVIDPLDGTSNYVHRFPYYAVSIGLEHEGKLVVGVVYDPTRDEMFSAAAGSGATLNGRAIRPSRTDDLRFSMTVASLPIAAPAEDPAVKRFVRILGHAQTVQRTGSAAMNLAYTACGRIDAFWSSSLKPWDVAGGAVLVSEAGGRVSSMSGGPLDIHVPDVLATNGTAIHLELQRLLV